MVTIRNRTLIIGLLIAFVVTFFGGLSSDVETETIHQILL